MIKNRLINKKETVHVEFVMVWFYGILTIVVYLMPNPFLDI